MDQDKFWIHTSGIVGSDLSQMNIQKLRYTRRIRYLYLAEYRSTQVNDGVNLKTITHEVNGELNCKVIPNTWKEERIQNSMPEKKRLRVKLKPFNMQDLSRQRTICGKQMYLWKVAVRTPLLSRCIVCFKTCFIRFIRTHSRVLRPSLHSRNYIMTNLGMGGK